MILWSFFYWQCPLVSEPLKTQEDQNVFSKALEALKVTEILETDNLSRIHNLLVLLITGIIINNYVMMWFKYYNLIIYFK